MKPRIKVAIVFGGYVVAFLIAGAAIALYVAATSGVNRQTYAAMYEFGDSLLFLAVFGVAAVPATAAGLYFLRPYRPFWIALSAVALALAVTAVAAFIAGLAARAAMQAGSHPSAWAALASLIILAAPLCALAFLVAGIFAPARPARIALIVATVTEVAVFASWFLSLRHY